MPTRDEVRTHAAIQSIPGELEEIRDKLGLVELSIDRLTVAVETLELAVREGLRQT